MNKFFFVSAIALLATPVFAQEEATLELTAVPAAVMTAAQGVPQAAGVTFDKAQMDDDEGTATYEISGKMANGMMLEVDVLEDGTIEEIEEQIELAALPAPVKASLDAELAGFVPTFIEKSTRSGDVVVYEFEGSHDGKEIDAEINADGTGFTMADDAAA